MLKFVIQKDSAEMGIKYGTTAFYKRRFKETDHTSDH